MRQNVMNSERHFELNVDCELPVIGSQIWSFSVQNTENWHQKISMKFVHSSLHSGKQNIDWFQAECRLAFNAVNTSYTQLRHNSTHSKTIS